MIADHIRTLSFAIADGIQPGNNDRNYVLRRILRRAVRYGRTLGFHEPFFYKLVDVLADTMGDVFPEIRAKKKHVQEVIRTEEEAFNKTLDRGIELLENAFVKGESTQKNLYAAVPPTAASLVQMGSVISRDSKGNIIEKVVIKDYEKIITGSFAFDLYDTYGFPLDLTELMARERDWEVDKEGFETSMKEQRTRARAAQKKTVISLSEISDVQTKFVGYDQLEADCNILHVLQGPLVVVDVSPLYAEMGGQVGDAGGSHLSATKPVTMF